VFDAEDEVHPALLRRVDQCFQETDADIVQAGVQLMNFRSAWYTVHNVLEYYFWFRSRLHVHARQRFIPLGGNTVFIRTPILRAVDGWWDCLAEDCEIGVRLSALGARTAVFYEPDLVTRAGTRDTSKPCEGVTGGGCPCGSVRSGPTSWGTRTSWRWPGS
jgi:cellulose synthase/poly-beta-1,6-N-acetylglucosamine synthase-like glycosyltransferase